MGEPVTLPTLSIAKGNIILMLGYRKIIPNTILKKCWFPTCKFNSKGLSSMIKEKISSSLLAMGNIISYEYIPMSFRFHVSPP